MTVMFTQVAAKAGFVCTASEDGHVKFWKKMQRGVEFVKHFHAHVGPIADVAASFDGLWLATTGDDGAAKLYDVHAFDMACILRTKRDAAEPYVPGAACWLQTAAAPTPRVALAAADEAAPIRVYAAPTFALVAKLRVHASPVVALCPLPPLGLVVSADARGVLECWRCADGPRRGGDGKGAAVSEVPAEAPGDAVAYRSKLDTDLYALAKARAGPCRISASSDGARFAVTASDATIRIFETRTGRCLRLLDESAAAIDARRGAWLLRRARGFLRSLLLGSERAEEFALLVLDGLPRHEVDLAGHREPRDVPTDGIQRVLVLLSSNARKYFLGKRVFDRVDRLAFSTGEKPLDPENARVHRGHED